MADPIRIAHLLADAAFDAWHDLEGRDDLNEEIGMGADGTPTTRADAALDLAIIEVARQIGVNVLSEEAGHVDHGGPWTAVVDPLDGSRNAGRGIPFFCTSIAVGRDALSGVEAGVVKNLVTADLYSAQRGEGATMNGHPVRPRPFDPEEVLVAMIADYEDAAALERMQRNNLHMRDLGSAALEMCLVGTGALDAFDVRKDWVRVIDIAAATLFVREAGGQVLDPRGWGHLDMPFDLTPRTGIVAVATPGALEAVR